MQGQRKRINGKYSKMRDFEGRNYINGEWRATADMYTKINPATGKAQGAFPLSCKDEVGKALLSARKAFKTWKKVSRFTR